MTAYVMGRLAGMQKTAVSIDDMLTDNAMARMLSEAGVGEPTFKADKLDDVLPKWPWGPMKRPADVKKRMAGAVQKFWASPKLRKQEGWYFKELAERAAQISKRPPVQQLGLKGLTATQLIAKKVKARAWRTTRSSKLSRMVRSRRLKYLLAGITPLLAGGAYLLGRRRDAS
jgi:hypothetical protein